MVLRKLIFETGSARLGSLLVVFLSLALVSCGFPNKCSGISQAEMKEMVSESEERLFEDESDYEITSTQDQNGGDALYGKSALYIRKIEASVADEPKSYVLVLHADCEVQISSR